MELQKILHNAEKSCAGSGTRFTEKRKRVLTCLLAFDKAVSAYDIVAAMQAQYDDKIPPMSVYRILEFLETQNLVHKLSSNSKYVACSHIACEHSHEIPQFLICDKCDKVKEIKVQKDIIASLYGSVKKAGYALKSHRLELHCLCDSCNNLQQKST
ncbi:Fur family transcriptional regulator [Teredinibacter franksiae]|jgi:Fe2+/Zn2+ uptake regulation proteins|uniref:Fur family transcriptional regulator n=1 Tax=Teredinibacter franksiae TaxID=2761453 RepID=UPI001625FE8F|nr:Fur family transcriptional regulator [Teredinibacter franksiae]